MSTNPDEQRPSDQMGRRERVFYSETVALFSMLTEEKKKIHYSTQYDRD